MGTSTFKNCKIKSIKVLKNTPEEVTLIDSSIGSFLYKEPNPTNGRNKLTLKGNFGTASLKIQSPCCLIFTIGFSCGSVDIKTITSNPYDSLTKGTYVILGSYSKVLNGINIQSNALLCLPNNNEILSKKITIGDLSSNKEINVILQGDFNTPCSIIGKASVILDSCILSDLIIPNDTNLPVYLELYPNYKESPLIAKQITLGDNVTLSGSISQINSCISPDSSYIFDGYIEDVYISDTGTGFQNIPIPLDSGNYLLTAYLISSEINERQIGTSKVFNK